MEEQNKQSTENGKRINPTFVGLKSFNGTVFTDDPKYMWPY